MIVGSDFALIDSSTNKSRYEFLKREFDGDQIQRLLDIYGGFEFWSSCCDADGAVRAFICCNACPVRHGDGAKIKWLSSLDLFDRSSSKNFTERVRRL